MRLTIVGAGPTALGAAYRLQQLINEGRINSADLEVTIFEKVSHLVPTQRFLGIKSRWAGVLGNRQKWLHLGHGRAHQVPRPAFTG